MNNKFERKCAIVSFSEEVSSRNTVYAKLRLMDEDGKQCDAFYFGYVETDKEHLSDTEAVYDIYGILNDDGSVKIKDITRLEDSKASSFHKNLYDVKDLSKKLLTFVKENVPDKKYLDLLKATVFSNGNLTKFCKAPFHPTNNHDGSLLDHVVNCLDVTKSLVSYYSKYSLVIDSQAIFCATILYYVSKIELEKIGYCNYEFNDKKEVIGEDTMIMHYLLPKIEKLEDYVCLIDLISSMCRRTYSHTIEGRILNGVMNLDRTMQTLVIALHNKMDVSSKVSADFNGTKVELFYPSIQ